MKQHRFFAVGRGGVVTALVEVAVDGVVGVAVADAVVDTVWIAFQHHNFLVVAVIASSCRWLFINMLLLFEASTKTKKLSTLAAMVEWHCLSEYSYID